MFLDEVLKKLGQDVLSDFSLTCFGKNAAVIEGIKSVSMFSATSVRLRLKKQGWLVLSGEGLKIVEMGLGSVIIEGVISKIELD